MRIRVLGVAAGGGFPQWNCACPNCRGVREGTIAAEPLLQSSLAVSANAQDWYLINAGPDIRMQIESFPALHAGPAIRDTPLAGVILTDAELDHTIGLLSLREGSRLTLYGTETVQNTLHSAFPVLPMLENYCSWEWQALQPFSSQKVGSEDDVTEEAITLKVIPISTKPPLYAHSQKDSPHAENLWEVGLILQNKSSGRSLAYFPTLKSLSPSIEEHLCEADVLMVDGTFWSDDELVGMGATERGAHQMGHLPVGGPAGTAEKLATFPAKRKIFIHINNSNPILRQDSAQRNELEKLGFEVAYDGMELEI